MANHTNQVVLITGGASGIGKATAMKLAAKGVTVVITGRREATGAAAVKEIERVARDGAQVRFIRNDVTDGDPNYNEASISAMHPMNRLGRPEEIANGISFLLSDEASFITGHILNIDGGFQAK
jgi:NAD(P)-dependent dehydrogenase (short-subunit alcohol dehydrogenase family)